MSLHYMTKTCLALATVTAISPLWAFPVTLDTTWLDANSTLTLSQDAQSTLAITGITTSVGGRATPVGQGAYNIPVTSLSMDIGLLPPTLNPTKAVAGGSSLNFTNTLTGGEAGFANLTLDFKKHIIYGDVTTPSSSFSAMPLFTFDVLQPLTFSFKGGISLTESLGNLHFTDVGAQTFAAGLKIPDFLAPVFTQINFGSIQAQVVPWFRSPALKQASLPGSVSAVPEPAATLMLGMGLAALCVLMRRH